MIWLLVAGGLCAPALRAVGSAGLAPGPRCGDFVLATEAATAPWSWGEAEYTGALPDAYEVRLSWVRLSSDARGPHEVHLPGGALLVKTGGFGFYESEAQFARDGWAALPGHSLHHEHALRIRQRGRTVEVWIDGRFLARHTFASGAARRRLAVATKGYGGVRGRVLVRAFSLVPLQ
jgi:hypothetical protein